MKNSQLQLLKVTFYELPIESFTRADSGQKMADLAFHCVDVRQSLLPGKKQTGRSHKLERNGVIQKVNLLQHLLNNILIHTHTHTY